MKNAKQTSVLIFASIALLVLILDAKTAYSGAYSGIHLCINSFIPTFLPFIILTRLICSQPENKHKLFFSPLEKVSKIPTGSSRIMLLGFIGGYPLGAQCIEDAYNRGELELHEAKRMLGFCSNAGPAFIFGVLGPLFDSLIVPLWLLIIHIFSAVLVSIILPKNTVGTLNPQRKENSSITEVIESSVRTVSVICCWIILFRIIIEFINKWILFRAPAFVKILLFGTLELTNGIYSLSGVSCLGMRFVLASFMLGFGGLCVCIQTLSCTRKTGPGMYLPGKFLQSILSALFAYITQCFLFNTNESIKIPLIFIMLASTIFVVFCIFLRGNKKVVAFT